jgi:exonuclease 3'-5' domain-containing protein 2
LLNLTLISSSVAHSIKAPNLQTVWHPSNGIVFGLSTGRGATRTMSTAIGPDIAPNLISHFKMEDEFISSTSDSTAAPTANVPAIDDIAKTDPPTVDTAEEQLPEDPEQHEIPVSTRSFKMSEEMFRGARNAAPGSPESFWSHTLYRGPEVDGVQPKVKVHYCRRKHTTQRVLEQYFLREKILGFDIEWKPDTNRNGGIKRNVSLIQLASEDRIALCHIALYPGDKMNDLVAPSLKAIMEDPSITKVGVAIKADCTRLRKFLDIHPRAIFELSHLYKLVKFSSSKDYKLINKKLVSLATQVQEHLHLPMFKGEVRSSDWTQTLAMDQIIYSASDSYAGIHLFDTLELKRMALDPTPPRPFHAEENKPIRLAEGVEIPTDEELEPDEPELTTPKREYTNLSTSYLASAAESVELDPEFYIQTSLSDSLSLNSPSTTRSRSMPKPAPLPKHSLVLAAESLSTSYRDSHPKNRAAPACLRCYFIWYHNPDLSLQDIAALLREVPLQITTVVNYILESIKLEKLPFEKERLKGVLGMLPKDVAWSRYRTLARTCNEGVQ